ncbi:MAG: alpha/beta-hydrolase family protein, partial [Microthrixaceae bacterium]
RSATRFLIRQLDRVAPRAVSVTVGLVLIVVLIAGFAQGVLWRALVSGMEGAFSTVDESTAEGAEQPTSNLRSGGPESLVEWDELGRQGRNFTGRGPDVEQLEQVGGAGCCVEPIRVYVGLESAGTPEARAELAVEELDRTGAFDREVLVVYTATGTGYINPYASSSIEYLHGGDTALVSMQYSYLPSWLTVLLDDEPPGEATRALWSAIRERLDEIPADERPRVYAFGESLGSFGVENGFETVEALQSDTDGVLLIGATFDNPLRQQLTRNRVQGSPEWQPIPDVADVHFAQRPVDLPAPPEPSDPSRVVYLLNASDPVTWWNWGLLVDRPDWAGQPFATDRSPSFRWVPIVTFWQVVGDLPGAGNVPGGHGHIFGTNIVDGWLAVAPPADLPDEATLQEIRDRLDEDYED